MDALRYLIALIFAWAALGKLVRLDLATASAARLVPGPPRLVAGVAVAAEATVATLLALGAAPTPVAWVGAGLMLAAAVALGRARLRGRRTLACACFGGGGSSSTTLLALRAAAIAAACAVLATGGVGIDADRGRDLILAASVLVSLVLAVMVVALYRQVGVLMLRVAPSGALELASEGPPLGGAAPDLAELDRDGAELVVFTSPGCGLCGRIIGGVHAVARDRARVVRVDEHARPATFEDWRVPGTPYVVHLVNGVVVAKGLVNTLEQIEGLVSAGQERSVALVA